MRQASREAVFPSTPASSRSPSKKRWRPSARRAIRSPSGVRRTSRATTSASPAADRPASALVTLALEYPSRHAMSTLRQEPRSERMRRMASR